MKMRWERGKECPNFCSTRECSYGPKRQGLDRPADCKTKNWNIYQTNEYGIWNKFQMNMEQM